MEHITNVLVYSNRCEVLDSHIFTVGDKGLPHIRLKFIYMFGAETLQGKQLELKYILPDRSYHLENISISGKDEVLFPIHYSVFINGGWTTLKVALIEGQNKITLDDIIIKTKKLEVGEKFKNKKVDELIQAEVIAKTKEIKEEREKQKKEIEATKEKVLEEIENKRKTLKGDKGDRGIQGERGLQGVKGDKGDRGPGITSITATGDKVTVNYDDNKNTVFTVPTVAGRDGREIQDLSYNNNKLKITMSDNSSKEVEIKSGINVRKVFEGELLRDVKINLGTNWKICYFDYKFRYLDRPDTYTSMFINVGERNYRGFGQGDMSTEVFIENNEFYIQYAESKISIKKIFVVE